MNNIVTAELMLDEETTIRVQAIGAAYGDVSGGIPKGVMEQITQGIVQLSKPIGAALQETGAKRASVEYGIQLAVEGGSVIATFLSIGGQVNLNVTLEFEAEE
ncbi:MAG: hypothetical protein CV045_09855 [Cyanobacteria bacterium M5B4]|nr:MAG: hypothetical protein CV045_09855 [Cyanobacteria bacterium M5B4]